MIDSLGPCEDRPLERLRPSGNLDPGSPAQGRWNSSDRWIQWAASCSRAGQGVGGTAEGPGYTDKPHPLAGGWWRSFLS